MHIIYKTTNKVNNKIYIGVHTTSDLQDGYLGSGKHLKRAVLKHGKDNFTREILYFAENEEEMFFAEELIVDEDFVAREDTYNLRVGGKGNKAGHLHPLYGVKRTPEQIEKLKEFLRDNHPKGMLGKSHSEEARKKIGEFNKGKYVSEETRQKIREANIGKKMSEEAKKKMSDKKKTLVGELHPWWGRSHTEETKKKLSKANKGKKMSEEVKEGMSKRNKGAGNPMSRYIWITPSGVFDSAYTAAEVEGIDRKTVEARCKKGSNNEKSKPKRFNGKTWREMGWYVVNRAI